MGDDGDFVYDQFMDQPDKLPQEVQYDKFVRFMDSYGTQLAEMEQTLDATFGEVWDPVTDHILLDTEPKTKESIEDIIGLTSRDNKIFFKLMLLFPSLATELHSLIDEANEKLIPPLLLFGESSENRELQESDKQLYFGRILPLLLDLWNFCERTYVVVQNLMRQLASLYSDRQKKKNQLSTYLNVYFSPIWLALADSLGVLIRLDEIIRQNSVFTECASTFKRMMRTVRNTPEQFDTDAATAKRFEYLMQKLEADLLEDLIFQNCVDRDFANPQLGIFVKENTLLMAEMGRAIQKLHDHIAPTLGEVYEVGRRYQYMGLCGLYVLHWTLFKDKLRKDGDHKLVFKRLWDVQKKIPLVHLGGTAVFNCAEWLARRVPEITNATIKDYGKSVSGAKEALFASIDASLEAQVNKLQRDVMVWSSQFESCISVEQEGKGVISQQCEGIIRGVQYAHIISALFKSTLMIYFNLDRPLAARKVQLVWRLVELLKSIQSTFHRKSAVIANLISLIVDWINYNICRCLGPLKNRLKENQKRIDDSQIDQLSSLELVLHCLKGSPAPARLLVIRTALCVAMQKTQGLVKEADFEDARKHLRMLELVANYQPLVNEACDCSILYWFKDLAPSYMKFVFKNPQLVHNLPLVLTALHDPAPMLLKVHHLKDPFTLLNSFVSEIRGHVETHINQPLRKGIEDDLRLHIHSVVLGQDSRDLKTLAEQTSCRDFGRFIKLPPLHFFGEIISFRDSVEHYLDTQFYNITALFPHDWKTYEELRALSKEKFDLNLMEVHLPGATQEQGLDVLEITRNIHIFVARYTYNLNNQMFIEKPQHTTSKNLHTIHIRHIANSIRTHGTGIMNTTVNFVYQFLGKKFFIFSQFLYDDHIKSRLMKDWRQFLEAKEESKGMYPVKKAEKFLKDIRKLGVTDGLSFLDQFRELVTEIGNALGYVRMVRSGGLRFISDSIKFVPDITEIINFEEHAQKAELPDHTATAAKNLDAILTDLSQKFSEGSDYFRMLEDVFYDEMHKEKNNHLKNFFVIIPPMTLSYIEHIIRCKEQGVQKKGKEVSFTDDGFALGMAFILKLLRQDKEFDSLHWFSSVEEFYKTYLDDVNADMESKRKAQKGKAEAEITTMKLTKNKIETNRKEFELLYYSFRSSRVFFRDRGDRKDPDDEEGEEEEEEEEEA
eukprot:TRINITY_DN2013_c3_g2_i1.p1 TRINITY_DN2013_c3_g2~~TRINITY_DN2013_c3_g2_i1.p1  ORF type:complete len:1175 (-),score=403.67 TRINITY_DN2013_c3_g2_i1:71-3595(-)